MKTPAFMLGSSICTRGEKLRRDFTQMWCLNQQRADWQPQKIVLIAESDYPLTHKPWNCEVVSLPGNLGHVGMLMNGEKKHDFCGWSASMAALAMLAYTAELDFVYQESDCLLFGPCIEQAYRDLADGGIVFGHKQPAAPWQACSQSFFVVRHLFIPAFVAFYFAQGPDMRIGNLPESKFQKLEDEYGKDVVRRLSFGVDRCRPIPWDDRCWYAQHYTQEELEEITRRGLI